MKGIAPPKYCLSPVEGLVLVHHIVQCADASNDADRTVKELIEMFDERDGYVSGDVLQSALYCCNIENERGKFWHPLEYSFTAFVRELLPKYQTFDLYYNVIRNKDKTKGER